MRNNRRWADVRWPGFVGRRRKSKGRLHALIDVQHSLALEASVTHNLERGDGTKRTKTKLETHVRREQHLAASARVS